MSGINHFPKTELLRGPCDGQIIRRIKRLEDMRGCILATPIPGQNVAKNILRFGIYLWNDDRQRFMYLRTIECSHGRLKGIVTMIAKEVEEG